MKKEVFLERAFAAHGDKFDYSLVPDELNWKDKITVICASHGQFLITASNHVCNSRGCAKCGFEHVANIKKERSKDKFYSLAPILHDFKYDYSKVNFINNKTPVTITCKVHGDFEQSPEVHMRGNGCFKCGRVVSGNKQRDGLETFITKSKEVHGELYDYSKVEYVNRSTKVEILCKEHGSFFQKPNNHITGKNGCPKCLPDKLSEKHRMNCDIVRENVTKILEKDNRRLIEFNYRNSNSFCVVQCEKHGEQKQRVRSILAGVGCFKCGVDSAAIARSKGIDDYLPTLLEKYGNFYDYSESQFTNSKERFIVNCHIHGQFKTTISNHLKGKGCPKCGSYLTGYRAFRSGSFYILKITEDVIKFGISNDFEKRLKKIQSKCCFEIEPLYIFNFKDGSIPREIESEIINSNIRRGVVSPSDMNSGYTETCYYDNISYILSVVDKYKDQLS